MAELIKMRWHINEQTIPSQPCPICGKSQQRVVASATRPDFVICGGCHSAYVVEDGLQQRRLYGQIPAAYPQTRSFALKQWRTVQEIAGCAEHERRIPAHLIAADIASIPVTTDSTQFQTTDDTGFLFRRLRETGELPNIDDLFEDKKPKSG